MQSKLSAEIVKTVFPFYLDNEEVISNIHFRMNVISVLNNILYKCLSLLYFITDSRQQNITCIYMSNSYLLYLFHELYDKSKQNENFFFGIFLNKLAYFRFFGYHISRNHSYLLNKKYCILKPFLSNILNAGRYLNQFEKTPFVKSNIL